MDTFDIIIILLLIFGIGIIIYIFLRDPIHNIKTFLRGLKRDDDLELLIVLFIIWSPLWLIDKLFGLNIYTK